MADQPWEIVVAPNKVVGRRWAQHLYQQGIVIRERDVYSIIDSRKWEGARFTKVYLTPYVESPGSIRAMIERVQALQALHQTCIKGGDRFEGYFIISPTGQIFGPQKTL
jgi:hypothetical protein